MCSQFLAHFCLFIHVFQIVHHHSMKRLLFSVELNFLLKHLGMQEQLLVLILDNFELIFNTWCDLLYRYFESRYLRLDIIIVTVAPIFHLLINSHVLQQGNELSLLLLIIGRYVNHLIDKLHQGNSHCMIISLEAFDQCLKC